MHNIENDGSSISQGWISMRTDLGCQNQEQVWMQEASNLKGTWSKEALRKRVQVWVPEHVYILGIGFLLTRDKARVQHRRSSQIIEDIEHPSKPITKILSSITSPSTTARAKDCFDNTGFIAEVLHKLLNFTFQFHLFNHQKVTYKVFIPW